MTPFDPYANPVLIISMIVGALAVARITRLFVDDQIMNWYRLWVDNRWGTTSWQSYLAHCPWCTSIWVSALVMPVSILLPSPYPWSASVWLITALSIPATSMVAGLLVDRGK